MSEVINPEVLIGDIVNQAVARPSEEERVRMERLELLKSMRISTQTEVVPERYALSVDGVGIFALGDIHGLKGKQKSGKSAVLKVCSAALLKGEQFRVKSELEEPVVLFIDTEQQAADVKLVVNEVKQMSSVDDEYIDSHLFLYTLRRRSYDSLLEDTRLLIDIHRPQVVFIDGLVDYVASFNDEVLSRQLIHELLQICEDFHCAVVNVLHENKASDDENMRGHLGTVLAQKAGSVLKCSKDKRGLINVTCPDSRHGQMPSWNIMFDAEGHLMDADEIYRQEQEQKSMSQAERNLERHRRLEQQRVEAIQHILRESGGYATRKELKLRLMERLKIGESTVQKFIKDYMGKHINEMNGYVQLTEDSDLFT